MPSGSRVRANNVYGTVSDNPLLIGAVSFTSLGLNLLPAISGQHAVAVLDPKRVFGEPEIVVITSHTAMGTTATITRGQYGTTARQHPQGTAWAHVPVGPDDYIAVVTSGTRPSNPYEGQEIYETDTDYTSWWNGTAWEQGLTIGAWTNFTPVWTQSTTVTKTVNYARYSKIGRKVTFTWSLTATGSGTASNTQSISLPFAPAFGAGADRVPSGSATFFDASVNTFYHCLAAIQGGGTTIVFYPTASTGGIGSQFLGLSNTGGTTQAVASGDLHVGFVTYEAVS